MDIEEVTNEGLKRTYKVSIGKDELDGRIDSILMDVRQRVNMKGFRPGKAPLSLLRKLHGEAAMQQAIEDAVRESTDKVFSEKGVRPATQPDIDVGEVDADKGLDFTISAEILPDIEVKDFSPPKLEKLVAEPSESEVEAGLQRLAEQSKSFETAAKTYKAKSGDAVVIDFTGTVDGEAFEGGSGEDVQVELGAGQFLQEIEDALVGAKTGEQKQVSVTFPDTMGDDKLAGRKASFDVTVKEVKKPKAAEVDETLATNFGFDDLDGLRQAVREQLESEAQQLSRAQVKRNLLDKLAEQYDFEVPERMVDAEYRDIWRQIKQDAGQAGEASQEEMDAKNEPDTEAEREDYRQIAERRVRLGLLLSEIGMANNVELSREEVQRRAAEEARKYPGQEQQIFEFITQNEQVMAQLRAPLYEDKVVDFILEMAETEEKSVDIDELRRVVMEEEAQAEPGQAGDSSGKSSKASKSGKSAKSGKAKKTKSDSAATGDDSTAKTGSASKAKSSAATSKSSAKSGSTAKSTSGRKKESGEAKAGAGKGGSSKSASKSGSKASGANSGSAKSGSGTKKTAGAKSASSGGTKKQTSGQSSKRTKDTAQSS